MDTLLLILLIAALLVFLAGGWWLRDRVKALEERLQELGSFALVPDRLQALARVVENLEPEEIRQELMAIRDQLRRVEDLVAVPVVGRGEEPEPDRPAVIRALVTRHLRESDYEAIKIVDDIVPQNGQATTVQVECLRHGHRLRGSVVVEGDDVVETRLEPSYTMFP